MPEATFLGGFYHALDRNERYHALAAHLDQQKVDQQLQRDRLAQADRLATVDDRRLQAQLDEKAATEAADQSALSRYLVSLQPPHPANLVQENPAMTGGQPMDPAALGPARPANLIEQNPATTGGASPAVGRAILGDMARRETAAQTAGLRERGLDLRAQAAGSLTGYRNRMAAAREQGLDETAAHHLVTEGLRSEAATMTREDRERKHRAFQVLAHHFAQDDPELAADYLTLADGLVNPISAAREKRLQAGPQPSAQERLLAGMSELELLTAVADPKATAQVRMGARRTLRERMGNLPPETLLHVYHTTDDTPTMDAVRSELSSRGYGIGDPWYSKRSKATLIPPDPDSVTAAPRPKAQSAHDEPLVPSRAPAPSPATTPGGDDLRGRMREYLRQHPGATFEDFQRDTAR